jgi:hypothetical protein
MSNPTRRTQHPPLELKPNATRLVCIAVTGVRETPEPNMMNPTRIPTPRTQPPPLELKLNAARPVRLAVTDPEPNTLNPNSTPPISFTSLSPAFVKAQNPTRRNQTQCRPSRSSRCHRHSQSPAPALWSQSRLMGQLFPVDV